MWPGAPRVPTLLRGASEGAKLQTCLSPSLQSLQFETNYIYFEDSKFAEFFKTRKQNINAKIRPVKYNCSDVLKSLLRKVR